jgi:transposase-like protein
MRKERKHFTPEEKVAILRRHLVDRVPVSELCEELGLRPTVFYRWQKELFENGAAAFQSQERPQHQVEEKQKRIEHKSLKSECIRPGTPLSLEDAKRLIQQYVDRYNYLRLHSAIGYVTPKDMLAGHQQEIQAERDRKLDAAKEQRKNRRQRAA